MAQVNYIKHLNNVFEAFLYDDRLNPTHISIYMALFQVWNSARFPEKFFIIREEVMKLSKIGSKSTYHRCLKELHTYQYIEYKPSHNPYRGSTIRLTQKQTSSKQAQYQQSPIIETSIEQALVPKYKHNKTLENNLNYKREKEKESKNKQIKKVDNLKVNNNKNYNQPL